MSPLRSRAGPDAVVAPGAAPHPVAPGHPLVGQQRRGDPVVQFRLRADAALVSAAGLQPDGKGVGDIQPDHGQDLAVVHRDVVVDHVADEGPGGAPGGVDRSAG